MEPDLIRSLPGSNQILIIAAGNYLNHWVCLCYIRLVFPLRIHRNRFDCLFLLFLLSETECVFEGEGGPFRNTVILLFRVSAVFSFLFFVFRDDARLKGAWNQQRVYAINYRHLLHPTSDRDLIRKN